MTRHNNCMNLTRISRVKFWAKMVACASYANRYALLIQLNIGVLTANLLGGEYAFFKDDN